jgi:hypothetical protein
MSSKTSVNILYNNKTKILTIPYNPTSTITDIKKAISSKYAIDPTKIELTYNNSILSNDKATITSIIKNSANISMKTFTHSIIFYQVGNPNNNIPFEFDIFTSKTSSFKSTVVNYFKQKMEEINFDISSFDFFQSNLDESKPILSSTTTTNNDNNEIYKTFNFEKGTNFYFLIKEGTLCFYQLLYTDEYEPEEESEPQQQQQQSQTDQVEIRKNVSSGQKFKVFIQTYNHLIKEIEVFPEMTIGELKEEIEKNFLVKKEYQELLYLVYKLDDNSKLIKDYYVRPQGSIFLRGFYFPLLFVDYYDKRIKKVIQINIAEKVNIVINELITKMTLDNTIKYKLIVNGKELEESKYLIDYNIQKMQVIYIK